MTTISYILEQTNHIRKQWLNAFLIYMIFFSFDYLLLFITGYCTDTINNNLTPNILSAAYFIIPLFSLLLLYFWSHYYFMYKKKGTRLLVWIGIVGGLKFISNISVVLSNIKINFMEYGFNNTQINFYNTMAICEIAIITYYLFHCYKLYYLNYDYHYSIQKIKLNDNNTSENNTQDQK